MQIWLDTTNIEVIQITKRLGMLFGVTTNPALIAQSGKKMGAALQDLLDHQDGPVTAQVIAKDTKGMIQQGKKLYDFSDRIIVKIPVTHAGLEAINELASEEIPTMATVVLEPHQAFLAGKAGANYIAPYVNQIEKNGQNPWDSLASMLSMYMNSQIPTEILAASINTLDQFNQCAELGIPHITLKDDMFMKIISTVPATQQRIDQFAATWDQSKLKFL